MPNINRLLVSSCALLAGVIVPPSIIEATPIADRAASPDEVAGQSSTRIIVKFAPGVADAPLAKDRLSLKSATSNRSAVLQQNPPARASAAVTAAWQHWEVAGMRPVYGHDFADVAAAARRGLDRTFVLEVPAGTDTEAMAAAFAALGDQIETAEVDAVGTVAEFIPNDSGFYRQYGMHNTEQTGGTYDADIDAPEAWAIHTGDVGSVTVAIVDTGVTPHAEFDGRMVPGTNTTLYPDDGTGDDCPHGTHVAGIVAAAGNNGVGVAGVTWGAYIMPVRVFDGCSGYHSYAATGIIWAVDNGADIINISLQFPNGTTTFEDAINYAYDNGVLVVAAAGNSGYCGAPGTVCFPARYANTVAVSGTTHDDVLATFANTSYPDWYSHYGDEIDVCAPGDQIWSTLNANYGYRSGTSMATPHVTGLAALLKSYDPVLTHDAIRTVIAASADDLGPVGWDDHYGHGRINAYQALVAVGPTRVVESWPPDGAIDGRQPFEPDGSNPDGWDSVDLTIGGDTALVPLLEVADFAVTQEGGVDPPPTVVDVLPVDGEDRVVRVTFDRVISVRAWTTTTHIASGTSATIGFLPGDVNGDGTAAPADILRVIDAINGVIELPTWSTDVDRSGGDAGPPDILRVIDLLNGAGDYEPYLNVSMP